jgi:hypothetical protein
MSKLGWGLSSLTFGTAVNLSQPKGVIYLVIAWGSFAAGGVLVAIGWAIAPERSARFRKNNGSARARRELRELGGAILDFLGQRESEAPSGTHTIQARAQRSRGSERRERILREFEEDTLAIHREQFASDVRRLLRQVAGSRVGRNEALTMLTPQSLEDLAILGWRLIELGRSRSRYRYRSAA